MATMLLALVVAPPAHGQSPTAAGDILWLVDESPAESAVEILAGIEEALAAERGGHLLGEADLVERVASYGRPLSSCAFGVERCATAEAMAFDALGLGLVIRLSPRRRGDTIEISYEMVDRRGARASRGRVDAQTARQGGFELVRELFDAVGVVSFESRPAGATVFVDDEEVGQTPLSHQFGVGTYRYRIEMRAHDGVEGEFEVRTGSVNRVDVQLARRPGRLRIGGAPEGAQVYVGGQEWGRASEMLDLDAGEHAVEIRAEGYEPYRAMVEIEAEEVTELTVEMRSTRSLLRDVPQAAITDRPFQISVGVEMGFQMATFDAARGQMGDEDLHFVGWLDGGVLEDGGNRRVFVSPAGLRLDAGWEGRHLGLTLLSLSVVGQRMEQSARLRTRAEGADTDVLITQMRSIQLRPMQLRYRFFYENMAPFIQGGLGLAFQRMNAQIQGEEDLFHLRQIVALGAVEAGVRYHFDARWSVIVGYRQQRYFSPGLGAEHTLGVSLGMGLRDFSILNPQPPGEL